MARAGGQRVRKGPSGNSLEDRAAKEQVSNPGGRRRRIVNTKGGYDARRRQDGTLWKRSRDRQGAWPLRTQESRNPAAKTSRPGFGSKSAVPARAGFFCKAWPGPWPPYGSRIWKDGTRKGQERMKRIAIPDENGRVSAHFGHCPSFAIYEIDEDARAVHTRKSEVSPPHEPGAIPRWLKELGVQVVLSGGMGRKAIELFKELGIEPVVGVSGLGVDEAVQGYLSGRLNLQSNACDH